MEARQVEGGEMAGEDHWGKGHREWTLAGWLYCKTQQWDILKWRKDTKSRRLRKFWNSGTNVSPRFLDRKALGAVTHWDYRGASVSSSPPHPRPQIGISGWSSVSSLPHANLCQGILF